MDRFSRAFGAGIVVVSFGFGGCGDLDRESITLDQLIEQRNKMDPRQGSELMQKLWEGIDSPAMNQLSGRYRGTILFIPGESDWPKEKRDQFYQFVDSPLFPWRGKVFDLPSKTGYNWLDLRLLEELVATNGGGSGELPKLEGVALEWIKALGSERPFVFSYGLKGSYESPSKLQVVELDYSGFPENPFPTKLIKDEVRQLNSKLLIGKANLDLLGSRSLLLYFALERLPDSGPTVSNRSIQWGPNHASLTVLLEEQNQKKRLVWPVDLASIPSPSGPEPTWIDYGWEQSAVTPTSVPVLMEARHRIPLRDRDRVLNRLIRIADWRQEFFEKVLTSDIAADSQSLYATAISRSPLEAIGLLAQGRINYSVTLEAGWGADDILVQSTATYGRGDATLLIADQSTSVAHSLFYRDFFVAIQDRSDGTFVTIVYASSLKPRAVGMGEAIKRNKETARYFIERILR